MGKGADEMRYREDHSHNGGQERKTLNMDHQSPDEIQREIERTRAEMDQTIHEIQNRLSTDRLMDQAMDSLKVAVREGTPRLIDAVKRNPVPVSILALGVSLLLVNNMRKKSHSPSPYYGGSPMESDLGDASPGVYYEGKGIVQQGTGKIKGAASHLKEAARDKASHLSHAAREKAAGMAEHLAQQARAKAAQISERAKAKSAQLAAQARERAAHMAQGLAHQAREKTAGVAHQAKERTMGLVSQARERTAGLACDMMHGTGHAANRLAHRAGEQARHLGTAALGQGRRAKDQFWHQVDSNPMALGAIMLAVGTAIGLCLPETERENQLMGDTRDNLLNRVKETGREAVQKVSHVASAAQQAAAQELEKQNLTQKPQGSEFGRSGGQSSNFEGMLKSPSGDDISVSSKQGTV